MPLINLDAVLNPLPELKDHILDYIPRATTSKFGIVALGSGINVDSFGRISLDTQEYSNRLTAIETTAASTLETTVNTLETKADELAASITQKLGTPNGIATLDSAGSIPASQLPSYVDDVLEYENVAAFPATGETGKIYVETAGNTTYRWGGTGYVKITSGEVSTVAGKTGVVTLTKADVGLDQVDNTPDAQKPISTATQLALNHKINKAETYTKQESDNLVNNSISAALTSVNASLDLTKRGIANRYDSLLTYNSGERVVLANGDIVKSTVDGNTNDPNVDMVGWVKTNSTSQIFNESGESQQEINNGLESIAELASILSPSNNSRIYVKSYYSGMGVGGGYFVFSSSNLATQVANDPLHGIYVPPSSNPLGTSGAWVRQDINKRYQPEWFGYSDSASITDKTSAISQAAKFGAVYLTPKTTYLTKNVTELDFITVFSDALKDDRPILKLADATSGHMLTTTSAFVAKSVIFDGNQQNQTVRDAYNGSVRLKGQNLYVDSCKFVNSLAEAIWAYNADVNYFEVKSSEFIDQAAATGVLNEGTVAISVTINNIDKARIIIKDNDFKNTLIDTRYVAGGVILSAMDKTTQYYHQVTFSGNTGDVIGQDDDNPTSPHKIGFIDLYTGCRNIICANNTANNAYYDPYKFSNFKSLICANNIANMPASRDKRGIAVTLQRDYPISVEKVIVEDNILNMNSSTDAGISIFSATLALPVKNVSVTNNTVNDANNGIYVASATDISLSINKINNCTYGIVLYNNDMPDLTYNLNGNTIVGGLYSIWSRISNVANANKPTINVNGGVLSKFSQYGINAESPEILNVSGVTFKGSAGYYRDIICTNAQYTTVTGCNNGSFTAKLELSGQVTQAGNSWGTRSVTYDPPSLAAGASTTTTVSVSGVTVGDLVAAAFSQYHADIEISATVSALNTVTVKFKNTGAASVDLASGTLSVKKI